MSEVKFGKVYLGDGVYLTCDGYHLVLTTENGLEATNTIMLEPHMVQKIQDYLEKIIETNKGK